MATEHNTDTGYYIVVKTESYRKTGALLSSRQAAETLLTAGIWPLWRSSRTRKPIKAGDRVAVCIADATHHKVVATSEVAEIDAWNDQTAQNYPLIFDETPHQALRLQNTMLLHRPVEIKRRLTRLSFVQHCSNLGAFLREGLLAVSKTDFKTMTRI